MSWNTIRKATETDVTRLNEAAERFCTRHNIEFGESEFGYTAPTDAVDNATSIYTDMSDTRRYEAQRLRKLWVRIMRRALNAPTADGIAYGYVGRSVN